MKIISLDKIYDFYCDWYFEVRHGNILTVSDVIEKHEIMSTGVFMFSMIYNMASDDFGDFCDAIIKSGVIIE